MAQTQFKHNKRRNCGLVYEFLVRRISRSLIDEDKPSYGVSLGLIRKYYGPSTSLAAEKELFDVVRNTRGVTESAARRILNEVKKQAQKLDARKIDIKKSNLIKEINHSLGQKLYSDYRVPEYKLLASIQMIVDSCRGENRLTESVARIQLEEGVVKYMTTTGDYGIPSVRHEEIDSFVTAIAAKKFTERYSKELCPSQQRLIEKYLRTQVTGDETDIEKFIFSERQRIGSVLDASVGMKEFTDDKLMGERLEEIRKRVKVDPIRTKLDERVEELALFQRLVEEIQSDAGVP